MIFKNSIETPINDASNINVEDKGLYFESENAEEVFQEVGFNTRGIYDDIPPAPIISARVGVTPPDLTTFLGNIKQYTFNATNHEVFGSSEITHRYKEGTNIMPHIHWANNGSEEIDKFVKWELEYTISTNGVYLAPVIISKEILIPSGTADRCAMIAGLDPDIVGANLKIGDYILWRLRRIVATGQAPINNPFAIAVGFHMEQDGLGSSEVFRK